MVIFCPHFCEADLDLIAILIFHTTGIKAALFLKGNFSHSIVYSVFLPCKQSSALIAKL